MCPLGYLSIVLSGVMVLWTVTKKQIIRSIFTFVPRATSVSLNGGLGTTAPETLQVFLHLLHRCFSAKTKLSLREETTETSQIIKQPLDLCSRLGFESIVFGRSYREEDELDKSSVTAA